MTSKTHDIAAHRAERDREAPAGAHEASGGMSKNRSTALAAAPQSPKTTSAAIRCPVVTEKLLNSE